MRIKLPFTPPPPDPDATGPILVYRPRDVVNWSAVRRVLGRIWRAFPRHIRLTVLLMVVFVVGMRLMLSNWRAAPPADVCIRYGDNTLVDVYTGRDVRDNRPVDAPAYQPRQSISPDGQYRVNLSLKHGEGSKATFALIAYPRNGEPFTLQDNMTGRIDFSWSPKDNRLAYYWENTTGKPFVTVADFAPIGQTAGVTYQQAIPTHRLVARLDWSPNGQFLLMEFPGAFDLWSAATRKITILPTPITGEPVDNVWGLTGTRLAYLSMGQQTSWITLLDLSAMAENDLRYRTFDLDGVINQVEYHWAPDGERLALLYFINWPYFQVGLYGLDGTTIPDVAQIALRGDSLSQPLVNWTNDGTKLIYLTRQSGGTATSDTTWDIIAFDSLTQRYTPVVSNILSRPVYAPHTRSQRMFVTYQAAEGTKEAALIDLDGANRQTVVRGANRLGEPTWSPDGAWGAVTWWQNSPGTQKAILTWTRVDGSGLMSLADDFTDIWDLRWLSLAVWPGGRLAFVARQTAANGATTHRVEMVDLNTGQRRTLADGFSEIGGVYEDGNVGGLVFWWRKADGSAGVDAYGPQGRIFRYQAAPGLEAYTSIEGLTPTQFDSGMYVLVREPGSPALFLSPGQPSPSDTPALLKFGNQGIENLHLARPNQSTQVIRSFAHQIDDPVWALDGTAFVFSETEALGAPKWINVFRRDGSFIRRWLTNTGSLGPLHWALCR